MAEPLLWLTALAVAGGCLTAAYWAAARWDGFGYADVSRRRRERRARGGARHARR